ncbi:hypothetical protein [Bacillus sp. T33-2]|uniref:hypothetical protein n=1 Tax=Bacillus sp. T33-2 TaxID=2054168 RepID=UPI000C77895B|nr:hypothetical protein [Bacillus sp. T33-2]PLR99587.1 hypothetical protein CVD19_00560 [Bacillus sp. T33-2]
MKIKRDSVSYNQDANVADKEVQTLLDKGYVITETYWNDFDCGQILELPDADNDVLERHYDHVKRCEEQASWRKKHFGWN